MRIILTPRTLTRLSHLTLACDPHIQGALQHILIERSGDVIRWCATNGRLLVQINTPVVTPTDDTEDTAIPHRLVVNGPGWTSALNILRKSQPTKRTPDYMAVSLEPGRAAIRLQMGTVVAVVPVMDQSYPMIQPLLARWRGHSFIPALQSFDPQLLAAATKIICNKEALLLWTPTLPGSTLPQVFAGTKFSPDVSLSVTQADLVKTLSHPAMWADAEMLVLVMGIARIGIKAAPGPVAFLAADTANDPGSPSSVAA